MNSKSMAMVLSVLFFSMLAGQSVFAESPGEASIFDLNKVKILGTIIGGQGDTIPLACENTNQNAKDYCKTGGQCYTPCKAASCKEQTDGSFECTAYVHHHVGSCNKNKQPRC